MAINKKSACLCAVGTFGVALLVTGCLLIHYAPIIINNGIEDGVIVKEGSAGYDNWKSPKSPVYFQVWFFNVDNVEAIMKNGSKPTVTQKGPYTYREEREKYNITFNDNGTVDYQESKSYFFVPEMSAGLENDTITCVNIPLMTVVNMVKDSNFIVRTGVERLIKSTKETLFFTKSVSDMLWGYEDSFLKDLSVLAKLIGMNIPESFGLFEGSNGTDDGVYEVYTGEKDIEKIGQIASWKGQSHLDFWTSKLANMINGSDGTVYSPSFALKETKYLFSSDLCRSIGMDYTDAVTIRGIDMERYVAPKILFANVSINPYNAGFCTPNGTCLPSGLLNVSNCHENAPLVMSMPHFLGCDQDIIDSVNGLHPVEEEHESFLNIEPKTGVTMQAAKRLQINIFLKEVEAFPFVTENLKEVYLPVAWLNESALIDQHDADKFKDGLYGKIELIKGIKFGLIALGGFVMLMVIIVLIYKNVTQQFKYRRFGRPGDKSLDLVT